MLQLLGGSFGEKIDDPTRRRITTKRRGRKKGEAFGLSRWRVMCRLRAKGPRCLEREGENLQMKAVSKWFNEESFVGGCVGRVRISSGAQLEQTCIPQSTTLRGRYSSGSRASVDEVVGPTGMPIPTSLPGGQLQQIL